MSSLERGTIVAGRYRLDRALAQGGMGCVWVARHLQLDVDVAIKFMTPQFAASADARARFEREARASAQLKVAGVVQIHDYGVEDGAPFLVMELLDGEDLETRLRREQRLTLAATLAVLEPVCRALRRAHEVGLVHRDLKPGNVFLARQAGEEVVKVLDFGIAKDTQAAFGGAATRTGAMLGSPQYMSPEQVRSSNRVDHRSDLWALGVIAFRCLTGRLPFPGDEVGEILVDVCTAPIPRPSEVAPDLGPEVDRFFERALVRDPEQRFQSAGAFVEALTALASGHVGGDPQTPGPAGVHPPPVIATPAPSAAEPGVARVPTLGTLSPSVHTQGGAVAPAGRGRRTGIVLAALGAAVVVVGLVVVGWVRARAPVAQAAAPDPVASATPATPPSATPAAPPSEIPLAPPSATPAAPPSSAPAATTGPARKPPAKGAPGRPARKGDDLLNHI